MSNPALHQSISGFFFFFPFFFGHCALPSCFIFFWCVVVVQRGSPIVGSHSGEGGETKREEEEDGTTKKKNEVDSGKNIETLWAIPEELFCKKASEGLLDVLFPLAAQKVPNCPKILYLESKFFFELYSLSKFAVSSLFHATATVRFLGTSGAVLYWRCLVCLSKEEEDGEEKNEVSLCRRVINMAHTPPPFPPPKITYKKRWCRLRREKGDGVKFHNTTKHSPKKK